MERNRLIRPATEKDAPEVQRMLFDLRKDVAPGLNTTKQAVGATVGRYLSAPGGLVLVAGSGVPVGFILAGLTVSLWGPYHEAHELGWWVDPGHREKGYGSGLLERFEEWALFQGATVACLGLEGRARDGAMGRAGYRRGDTRYTKALI